MTATLAPTHNLQFRPIEVRPEIILRPFQKMGHHALPEDRDGEKATLVGITKDCGGFYSFHCEIELQPDPTKTWKGDVLYNVPDDWFEFVDKSQVPETHQEPRAAHAWLCCYYRDRAWALGEFLSDEDRARQDAAIEKEVDALMRGRLPSHAFSPSYNERRRLH